MPQDKMTFIGVHDDQGRNKKPVNITDTSPTIRSETHGNPPKALYGIEVQVKEATKQGFAIARGGEIPSTSRCREARQEEDESG